MSRAVVRAPVAEFSRGVVVAKSADGVIRRRGVIFRSGHYPAQDFTMTPDELKNVASTFKDAIPLDHGHPSVDGPIDFGHLESVEASPDGTTLYGTTATPEWLDRALGGARWLVSASFDRATKAIRRLSLVTRPQISDAELQAAFACACNHDPISRTERTTMSRKEELQRLIDEAGDGDIDEGQASLILFPEARGGGPDDDDEDEEEFEAAPDPGPTAAEFALQQQLEEKDRRLEALEARGRRTEAERFYEQQFAAGRVLPTEKEVVVASHAEFARIDAASPAQFSAGRIASALAAYEASILARRPHRLTADFGAAGHAGVLDNGPAQPETPREYAARVNRQAMGKHANAGGNGR